jgi:hypothetical protein
MAASRRPEFRKANEGDLTCLRSIIFSPPLLFFLATIASAAREYGTASVREPILSKEKVAQQANLTRRGQ